MYSNPVIKKNDLEVEFFYDYFLNDQDIKIQISTKRKKKN